MDTNRRDNQGWVISRRVFLKASAGAAGSLALSALSCGSRFRPGVRRGAARFGIVTDIHFADADRVGTRYYRHSIAKLNECVKQMNMQTVDFLIELGDFKDQNNPPVEKRTISHLQTIETVFQKFNGPTYHVLGNHDMDSISKKQFLRNVENTGISSRRSYYSFDLNDLHFVILDANYKSDGTDYDHGNFKWTDTNVPLPELKWLKRDLAAARGRIIVFTHQLLDGVGGQYVKNAAQVRQILQDSGKALAVFQGHHHQGGYSRIGGIHYYTLKAMVEGPGPENSSYAIVQAMPDASITITGYRKAVSKKLAPAVVDS